MTDPASDCSVSVVMPVRNESGSIARSLSSVLEQDYPADRVQIIVVDGESEDGTPAIVEAMRESTRAEVLLLVNEKRTVPTGLNLGIAYARGDVIVRVDGHCELPRDYLRRCVGLLESTGADIVGGKQAARGTTLVGRAIALAMSSRFGVGDARFHYTRDPGWTDTVYLGAFDRGVFERIGTFDDELVRTQDGELNLRLVQAGGGIWLDPALEVTYHCRESLRALFRQYFGYGFYKVRMMQKRRRLRTRQLVAPAFVVALLVSVVGWAATRRPAFGVGVAGPYAVANVAASALAARRDPAAAMLLPATFATMHVAWGLGFLRGLWAWRSGFGRRQTASGALRPNAQRR